MRAFYLAPALLLIALLAACSDTPDDAVIRDALNQELKQAHLDELFRVTEVETAGRYPEDDDHVAPELRRGRVARLGGAEAGARVPVARPQGDDRAPAGPPRREPCGNQPRRAVTSRRRVDGVEVERAVKF